MRQVGNRRVHVGAGLSRSPRVEVRDVGVEVGPMRRLEVGAADETRPKQEDHRCEERQADGRCDELLPEGRLLLLICHGVVCLVGVYLPSPNMVDGASRWRAPAYALRRSRERLMSGSKVAIDGGLSRAGGDGASVASDA